MIIENKKISELKPAPYNPRESTEKQEENLKASLSKFGLVEPIIYNKQTNHIVGGHFRIRELKKLGIKEAECVIVDLCLEDEKELNIRLNANTGQWNWEQLANDWDSEKLEEWGLELPGFNVDGEFGEGFSLPEGDKKPFQQQTYTLSDKQAELISNAIADAKQLEEFNYIETFGNENSNGNALYLIISQWVEQKKYA